MEQYKGSLEGDAVGRYKHKLDLIGGRDPYDFDMQMMDTDARLFPDVQYPDIVNYCVYTKSAYLMQEFKCFKSLESFNQFVSGWVSQLCVRKTEDKIVVRAKVRHSQSCNLPPLQPWVICDPSGTVLTAHCNCMAGLGECCTHVGAALFAIDATVRREKAKTVTQEASYWMLPSSIDKVPFSRIEDIDFTSARRLKRKLDCTLSNTPLMPKQRQKLPDIPEPSDNEMELQYQLLWNTGTRPGILSIVDKFADEYVPKFESNTLPWLSSDLRNERCLNMTRTQIDEMCVLLFDSNVFTVSSEQSDRVEVETREQSSSKQWYRFRAGRITASNMKKVCVTSIEKPAMSTIKTICYPSITKFETKATQWGCKHEGDAIAAYVKDHEVKHEKFVVEKCGFVISTKYSYIGATPDSLVSCDCCGKGCLEVKCPYCVRDSHVADLTSQKNSSLVEVDGVLKLRKDHAHYFQVQTQILVCQVDYVDYVVWTSKGIHVERVLPDVDVLKLIETKSRSFFQNAVLPELLGSFFTRPKPHVVNVTQPAPVLPLTSEAVLNDVNNNTPVVKPEPKLYCFCQKPDNSTMAYIACDGENCKIEWFHQKCVKVRKIPKGKWFCALCRPSNRKGKA